MLSDLPKPLAVVAHDAGGANQIIALLQAHCDMKGIQAYMEGPAFKLWQQAFPANRLSVSIESVLKNAQSVLVGTGWASDLEYSTISKAIDSGLRVIALLDHWVNYKQRFIREGRTVWPDEFWVVDHYAWRIASQSFPGKKIKKISDYYLKNQLKKIDSPPPDKHTFLYLLEPIRHDWGKGVPGEFQALDYMVEKLPNMPLPQEISVRLRLHPSEKPDKYLDWTHKQSQINVSIDDHITLSGAISNAQWVAGCQS